MAVGGDITTIAGPANQYLFGFSHLGNPSRQLVLTIADTADVYRITATANLDFAISSYPA